MLDLRAPSVSLDTACSSSLVAVAVACDSLWSGRCDGALAGGVNALISPHTSVGFSKATMISPTGDCFAFDARANGFVRAEGAGVVYLKPLATAVAAGDRISAVVRAAVVNQDGHTADDGARAAGPERHAGRSVWSGGISPAAVAHVEGAWYGHTGRRSDRKRWHWAGARSRSTTGFDMRHRLGQDQHRAPGVRLWHRRLHQAALVLHHRTIPPTLNYERPRSQHPLDDLRLRSSHRRSALSRRRGPQVAGVNAFGSEEPTHAVLEEGLRGYRTPAIGRRRIGGAPHLLSISARDDIALRAYVEKYREVLADPSIALADLCAGSGDRRSSMLSGS